MKGRTMELSEPVKEEIIRRKIESWEQRGKEKRDEWPPRLSTTTVSVEAGSGGTLIAAKIADRLEFDLFDKVMVEIIADSAEMSADVIRHLENARPSRVEDFLASFLEREYLYPGTYLRHLVNIVTAIGVHGHAVIVGRGGNFILPPEERFSVRFVAPEEVRIRNIAERFGVSPDEARARVLNRESKRTAFIKKSFNRDIADPVYYDLVVNTAGLSVDEAAEGVCSLLIGLREMTACG